MLVTPPRLRVARASPNLQGLLAFYRDGLGFEVLGSFEAHAGFDGIMLGHAGWPYHLEFTHSAAHPAEETVPSQESLLVFYLPERAEWQSAVDRMRASGFEPVPSLNPYWDVCGLTFADPDGWRVVLQHAASEL